MSDITQDDTSSQDASYVEVLLSDYRIVILETISTTTEKNHTNQQTRFKGKYE